MADTEETVVKEFDVHLSKALLEKLFLLQYPIRPGSVPYDDVTILSAKVKPKQQKVELELELNSQSPNYDYGKGEQIALNIDGQNPGDGAHFKGGIMNKQVLVSTKASSASSCAIGIVHGDEIHLTPVHSVLQLRPAFQYLETSDSHPCAGNEDQADGEGAEEELRPVTIRFAGQNTERARKAREKSYNYLQQQRASESWIHVKYHPLGSKSSILQKANLLCHQSGQDSSPFTNTCKEYLQVLTTDASSDQMENLPETSPAVSLLKHQCIPDQVKVLMKNAKVLSFAELLDLLPPSTDAMAVVRSLQQIAMLVQGCWVVKSDALYPKDTFSPISGVPAEILCKARDYIMWLFTQNDVIMHQDVIAVTKLPLEDLKEILNQMGKPTGNRGWKFFYSFDTEFVQRFPDVLKRQEMLWDAKYQQLMKALQIGADSKKVPEDGRNQGMKSPRRRKKSLRESMSDDAESGTELAASACVDKSSGDIKRSQRKLSTSKFPEPMDVDTSVCNQSALSVNGDADVQDNGPCTNVLDVLSAEEKGDILRCISKELNYRTCVTQSQLKQALAENCMLEKTVPDETLEALVIEAGGQRISNKWPINATVQPLYVFAKFGDRLDKVREGVIRLFQKNARISFNTMHKKLQDELGTPLSEIECKKVVHEFCTGQAGFYYLKGTLG